MPIKLIKCNVAIVADKFNPSIFSQLWLVRNGIIEEEDLLQGCIHIEQLSRIQTKQFQLLVIPPQLQFVPSATNDADESVLVADKVGAIVRLLPHTPYVAIGFNFNWHVSPEVGTVLELAKSLFYVPDSPISVAVGEEGELGVGAYFSRDMLGGRMRLDIKPVSRDGTHAGRLQFDFNFQMDLKRNDDIGDSVQMIEDFLVRWQMAKHESSRITQAALSKGARA